MPFGRNDAYVGAYGIFPRWKVRDKDVALLTAGSLLWTNQTHTGDGEGDVWYPHTIRIIKRPTIAPVVAVCARELVAKRNVKRERLAVEMKYIETLIWNRLLSA